MSDRPRRGAAVLAALLGLFGCAAERSDAPERPTSQAQGDADEPIASEPLPEDLSPKIAAYLESFGQNWPSFRFHGAVLVARDGDIAMLQAFGDARLTEGIPNTPHTRFRLGTLSAPITAATVLALVDRGQLALSDRVTKYLPEFPHGDEITVEHLLAHRSGIESFTDSLMFPEWKRRPHSIDETLAIVMSGPRPDDPGGAFSPSNSNYLVLGAIVERVTGETFGQAARRLVIEPAGMLATTYGDGDAPLAIGMQWNDDEAVDVALGVDPTAFGSAGGFVSTVEDLHRFLAMAVSGDLLSEASRARLVGRTPDDPGFGFMPDVRFGRRVVRWPGLIDGYAGAVEHYPADGTTIVVLANSEIVPPGVISDAIATVAYGGEVPTWEEPREAPIVLAQQLPAAGDYVITERSLTQLQTWADPDLLESMIRIRIVLEGDHLVLDVPSHGRRRMHPLSTRRFFFKDVRRTTAEVSQGADGTRRLSLRQGGGPEIRFVSLAAPVSPKTTSAARSG